jgi:hypothetical protein
MHTVQPLWVYRLSPGVTIHDLFSRGTTINILRKITQSLHIRIPVSFYKLQLVFTHIITYLNEMHEVSA